MSVGLSAESKAGLLMTKYSILRQETLTCISNYKAHVKYFQIVIGTVIAFFGVSLSKGGELPFLNSRLFWLVAMFLVTTVISYIAFDVIQSIYSMMVIGARLAVLEEMINTLANERLLAWESSLSFAFHGPFHPAKGVWQPGWFLVAYEFLLISIGLFAVPLFLYWRFWDSPQEYIELFRVLLIAGIAYSVGSVFCMGYSLVGAVRRIGPLARDITRDLTGRPIIHYVQN